MISCEAMSSVINCRALLYKFGSSGKDYKEAFNFRVKVNEDEAKDLKKFTEIIRYDIPVPCALCPALV